MTHPAKKLTLGSEFDAFLFAPIGEEKNGMLLSVLSALARLDIDPWREAAALARLPKGAANRRVMCVIAGLEIASTAPLELETIAARLIALLPRDIHSSFASREPPPAAGAVLSPRGLLYVVLLNLLLAVALTGARWAIIASHSPPVKLDIARASLASEVSRETPSPSSSHR